MTFTLRNVLAKSEYCIFRHTKCTDGRTRFQTLVENLNIDVTDVKIVAFHRHLSRIILKFSNEDNFNSFTSKNNSSVDFTKDGKTYNIPIHPTEITKLVRVRYVPDEMNLNLIKIKLEHHGTIKKIFREKFKGGLARWAKQGRSWPGTIHINRCRIPNIRANRPDFPRLALYPSRPARPTASSCHSWIENARQEMQARMRQG